MTTNPEQNSMAHDSKVAAGLLGINQAFRFFHNHRVDPAYNGHYYIRLPDGTPVPMSTYEERRQAFHDAAQQEADDILQYMRERENG